MATRQSPLLPSGGSGGRVETRGSTLVGAAFIYLAYWVYRIHGELAGAARSQRLLPPLAAMLIAILVPLGLPVLVMTLPISSTSGHAQAGEV